jgi:hypothetical protein
MIRHETRAKTRTNARPPRQLLALAIALFVTSFSLLSFAHKPSDSYLTLTIDGDVVQGRWDVALRDLAYVRDIDADGDGKITWREVQDRRKEIADYALSRLTVRSADATCPVVLDSTSHALASHSDGTYAVLKFAARCPSSPIRNLGVDYRLLFDVDAQHRGLLRLEAPGGSRTHVFSMKEPDARFDLETSGSGRQLGVIVKEGIFHIWTGYDHVLFLLALLLPSVLRREGRTWIPASNLRTALGDVLRIVTAFTVAHSITLSLAALGVVTLPSRLVESAIAASVVLASLNNLYPVLRDDRWSAAFLLGLMHGFGFSSTLMDLDLPRGNLVLTLFGFNLGVEIGQLAIVSLFVPLAYAVRASTVYRRGLLRAGSAGIFAIAVLWLVERAFVVTILP